MLVRAKFGLSNFFVSYQAYLRRPASDSPAQKALGFERMSRGWAHGTKEFKKALIQDQKVMRKVGKTLEVETAEMRFLAWEEALQRCLRKLRHQPSECARTRKAAPWKVAIATHLKERSTVTNPWLAQRLHMGAADAVSRYCLECRSGRRLQAAALLDRISDIMV